MNLLKEWDRCEEVAKVGLGLEPENAALKQLIVSIERDRQHYKTKSRNVFSRMFVPEVAKPDGKTPDECNNDDLGDDEYVQWEGNGHSDDHEVGLLGEQPSWINGIGFRV